MPSRLAVLLGEVGRRHAMACPPADAEGRFRITVDDVEVACFERFGQVCIVSVLGAVPETGDGGPAWLRVLLNEALRRMTRFRSTPAVDADGVAVLFTRCPGGAISAQDLEARIEEHVNAFEGYRAALARGVREHGPLAGRFASGMLRP